MERNGRLKEELSWPGVLGTGRQSHASGKFDMCCIECCVELFVQGNPMQRMKGYGTNSQRATAGTPWGMCDSKSVQKVGQPTQEETTH